MHHQQNMGQAQITQHWTQQDPLGEQECPCQLQESEIKERTLEDKPAKKARDVLVETKKLQGTPKHKLLRLLYQADNPTQTSWSQKHHQSPPFNKTSAVKDEAQNPQTHLSGPPYRQLLELKQQCAQIQSLQKELQKYSRQTKLSTKVSSKAHPRRPTNQLASIAASPH